MKNLKLIVLLPIIMLFNSIAFTQTISSDSIKCFSYIQLKKIAKDLRAGQLCDSISQIQELQIINFKEVVTNNDRQIKLISDYNKDLERDLKKTNLKLKISKKITTFGIPTTLGLGFLVGFLLKN